MSQHQQQPKTTNGPVHAVVCPSCGFKNDMREVAQQQLLDTGSTYYCDQCGKLMEVVGIQAITVVTVRPARSGGGSLPPLNAPGPKTLAGGVRGLMKGRRS